MLLRTLLWLSLTTLASLTANAASAGNFKAGYQAVLRHEYDKAIALLTDSIDAGDLKQSDQALAYHWRGAEYLHKGDNDLAIADFDRALALDPNLATAYSDRGIAYRREGRYGLAIADYTQAIRLWPNWHDWYLNRAISYEALGRHDEAIADFTKAVFYNPRLVSGYVLRADAYAEKSDLALAAADIRRAMSIKHDALVGFPKLAEKFRRLGLVS